MPQLHEMLIWASFATLAMTGVLSAAQGFGLSRLSIPFIVGTVFFENRKRATLFGYLLYAVGGLVFAFIYFLSLSTLNWTTWYMGGLLGLIHGALLLVLVFPLLPFFHPRMANEYEAPHTRAVLEPPGFLALNYGFESPLVVLVAQSLYGLILGGPLAALQP